VAESAVPALIGAGVAQLMAGVALLTVSETEALSDLYSVVFVGVNLTVSVSVPTARTVPAFGL